MPGRRDTGSKAIGFGIVAPLWSVIRVARICEGNGGGCAFDFPSSLSAITAGASLDTSLGAVVAMQLARAAAGGDPVGGVGTSTSTEEDIVFTNQ